MANTQRVDKNLFQDKHYLGKPADDKDRILSRRIELLEGFDGFFDKQLDLVEVGSGAGSTIARISGRFKQAKGIDIFDYSSAFLKNKDLYKAENLSFQQVDLENEKITEQFDRLISFEVIEHLKNEASVRAYAELLKPGGLAAISVPNKWWIFETHGARLPLLPWNRVPFFSWLPKPIHERFANARIYTVKRISKLLEANGFEVVRSQYITAPMDVLKDSALKRFLLRWIFSGNVTKIPFLSTSILIFARRKADG